MIKGDLQKIRNIFHLIQIIREKPKKVKELVAIIGVSKSQIGRYLSILRALGYNVETDKDDRKFIRFIPSSHNSDLTDEEITYLVNLLQHSKHKPHLKTSILNKFDKNLSLIPMVDMLPDMHHHDIITLINHAIQLKYHIKIARYHSFTSNTYIPRIVEPMELTRDSKYLIAWEPAKERQGQFKINRIQDIDILDKSPVENPHTPTPVDAFGLTGEDWKEVHLEMTAFAYDLMAEEFPLTRGQVTPIVGRTRKEKCFSFKTSVRKWEGIGRFVLGLPKHIDVIMPKTFKDYLNENFKKF
jgi:predicted DNA-binding transcriptional regulator YafY